METNMAFSKFSLDGKVALITGASGLLGQEHAYALLEAGATVILTDVSMERLELAKEKLRKFFDADTVIVKTMDVTSKDNIVSVSEELIDQGLRVDILVNNAAIDPKVSKDKGLEEVSRLENFSLDQWNLQLSVGLTGAFLCSQVFGSKMSSDGKGGVILNIASDLSVFSPDQRLYAKEGIPKDRQPVKPVTYSVIKTALIGLTRYLATYWSSQGVRCNALSPGGVFNGQDEVFVDRLTNLIPLNRMADADEYRSTIQFLCSDASSYMNGQNIIVDGGRSVW
jgi:NAD(P)-dependent dehydrogenase (short-subunit alcohol dehydrogenase family)